MEHEEEENVLTNEQPWEVAATRWIHAARAGRMGEGLRGGEGSLEERGGGGREQVKEGEGGEESGRRGGLGLGSEGGDY